MALTKSPDVPGSHLINIRKTVDLAELGPT